MNKELEALQFLTSLVEQMQLTWPQHVKAKEAHQVIAKALEPKEDKDAGTSEGS